MRYEHYLHGNHGHYAISAAHDAELQARDLSDNTKDDMAKNKEGE